jgi:hypothetical protein
MEIHTDPSGAHLFGSVRERREGNGDFLSDHSMGSPSHARQTKTCTRMVVVEDGSPAMGLVMSISPTLSMPPTAATRPLSSCTLAGAHSLPRSHLELPYGTFQHILTGFGLAPKAIVPGRVSASICAHMQYAPSYIQASSKTTLLVAKQNLRDRQPKASKRGSIGAAHLSILPAHDKN